MTSFEGRAMKFDDPAIIPTKTPILTLQSPRASDHQLSSEYLSDRRLQDCRIDDCWSRHPQQCGGTTCASLPPRQLAWNYKLLLSLNCLTIAFIHSPCQSVKFSQALHSLNAAFISVECQPESTIASEIYSHVVFIVMQSARWLSPAAFRSCRRFDDNKNTIFMFINCRDGGAYISNMTLWESVNFEAFRSMQLR